MRPGALPPETVARLYALAYELNDAGLKAHLDLCAEEGPTIAHLVEIIVDQSRERRRLRDRLCEVIERCGVPVRIKLDG